MGKRFDEGALYLKLRKEREAMASMKMKTMRKWAINKIQRGEAPFDAESEEIEVEGEACKVEKRGLSKGKNNEAWRRLVHHYVHFAENLSLDLARKEFHRRKSHEGDEVRGQMVPRTPSKSERRVYELTRWPYQDWCPR